MNGVQVGDQVRLPDGRTGEVWSKAPGQDQVWLIVNDAFTAARVENLEVIGRVLQ